MSLVEVKDLRVIYKDFEAVKGISFYAESGKVLGILGGNGAGKSSTLKTIATVNPASSGEIIVDGVTVTEPQNIDYGRQNIGYCPDVGGLIPQATIKEHLALALNIHEKTHLWDSALHMVSRFGLDKALNKSSNNFSHGMSRRLSVILALLTSRKVLILDEPFDGVDPVGVAETIKTVNEAKEAGLAVIISTHLQDLLIEACDDILIMSQGEIIARGKSEKFSGEEGKKIYKALLEENIQKNKDLDEEEDPPAHTESPEGSVNGTGTPESDEKADSGEEVGQADSNPSESLTETQEEGISGGIEDDETEDNKGN